MVAKKIFHTITAYQQKIQDALLTAKRLINETFGAPPANSIIDGARLTAAVDIAKLLLSEPPTKEDQKPYIEPYESEPLPKPSKKPKSKVVKAKKTKALQKVATKEEVPAKKPSPKVRKTSENLMREARKNPRMPVVPA